MIILLCDLLAAVDPLAHLGGPFLLPGLLLPPPPEDGGDRQEEQEDRQGGAQAQGETQHGGVLLGDRGVIKVLSSH